MYVNVIARQTGDVFSRHGVEWCGVPWLVDGRLNSGDVDADVTWRHARRVRRHVRVRYGNGCLGNADAGACDEQSTAGGRDDAAGGADGHVRRPKTVVDRRVRRLVAVEQLVRRIVVVDTQLVVDRRQLPVNHIPINQSINQSIDRSIDQPVPY